MGIGVAGYPEVHPESATLEADLSFLKLKFDRGADFAITQLFFDNNLYHTFVKRAREAGITKPIIPGILPVVSLKVIKRIVSLCGATIPAEFLADLEKADQAGGAAAVQKVGIAHARQQAQGASGHRCSRSTHLHAKPCRSCIGSGGWVDSEVRAKQGSTALPLLQNIYLFLLFLGTGPGSTFLR